MGGELDGLFKKEPKIEEREDNRAEDTLTIADMHGPARAFHKPLPRLHVMLSDGSVHTFQYCELGSNCVYKDGGFVLLFFGMKHYEIRVKGHGKDLWRAYDCITLHRWPYIKQASGNSEKFVDDGKLALTNIDIVDVTPKPEG